MKALILLVPITVFVLVWLLVVRYRGRLPKAAAHTVGAICGLVVGVLVLSAVLPDLSEAEKAKLESDRATEKAADEAKKAEQERISAAAADIARREVPQAALDRITVIYLNHKIFSDNPVVCTSKVFGQRSMVGCKATRIDGSSAPHVWLFEGQKFKSVNGTARSLAETRFSNEPDIDVMSLPLPADIDVMAVVDSFKKN